jgi:hypothetical protein
MRTNARLGAATVIALWASGIVLQATPGDETVRVTPDNFNRAESDMYFAGFVKDAGGLGKFHKYRELVPVEKQDVVRSNRDTLYSAAVFDLDAGPVTITVPDAGKRFLSLMAINEDHYVPEVVYGAGTYTFTKEQVGTRYVMLATRILVDPNDPKDVAEVHALQDAVKAMQSAPGSFEVPNWDQASLKKVRDALKALGATMPDSRRAFGTREDTDPVRHLIATAIGWGGNPDKDAIYLNVTPDRNDGHTVYTLRVRDVPVEGFWSISVYNAKGYFEPNRFHAYTLNNITAKKSADGSVDIQFGGCDGKIPNCLPIMPGWNYIVRLYRPSAEVLSGEWTFPEAKPREGSGTDSGTAEDGGFGGWRQ